MAETPAEKRARIAREKAAKSERDTRAVEAAARTSEAEAKRAAAEASARVEAARIEGENQQRIATVKREEADRAERARLQTAQQEAKSTADAEAKRRAEQAMPWQIGTALTALPIGMATGAVAAKMIDKRHQVAVAAANRELALLGRQATKLVDSIPDKGRVGKTLTAKLGGVVAAADKLNLGKLRGPVGLVPAGLLLSEAALVRFGIAPQIQDERARAVVNSVATASVFAATNLVGERMVQNATLKALPSATATAAIEGARKLVTPATKAGAAAPGVLANAKALAPLAGRVLSKAVPVLAVAMALYEGYQGYQKDGLRGAALGVGDSLTFGGVSAGLGYLNDSAAKRAAVAPAMAPTASLKPANDDSSAGRKSYTTVDNRVVHGTAAQVAAWESKRGRAA